MQFKLEMIQGAEEGLKEIKDKVKKTQDREFKLMKGLHTTTQTSGQGKALIGIEIMKNNFSMYLSNLVRMVSTSLNRVSEIQTLGGCIHVDVAELTSQLNVVKELTREHSKWLLTFTNVHVPNH